jgi:outer membrane protein TolC
MVGRVVAVIAGALLPCTAFGQTVWTEDDAVRAAISRPELAAVLAAELEQVSAMVESETRRTLPRLGADVEQVFGDAASRSLEATVGVETTFDVDGWRRDVRSASSRRADAARSAFAASELELATRVRRAFFAVRYEQERVAAVLAWESRLERGVADLTARELRGDVSRYELLRAERELATARARRVVMEDALAAAWAELESWVPLETRPELVGEIRPEVVVGDQRESPTLAQMEYLASALTVEAEAWRSSWLRDWTFGVGYRVLDSVAATGHGAVLSLSLPLAVRNNHAVEASRVLAQRDRVERERDLLRSHLDAAERAAETRLLATLSAVDSLDAEAPAAELIPLAEAAYASGEAVLNELLDAYESEAELALARLELEHAARRAAIDFDHLRGMGAR